jgi:hypothetical protein
MSGGLEIPYCVHTRRTGRALNVSVSGVDLNEFAPRDVREICTYAPGSGTEERGLGV